MLWVMALSCAMGWQYPTEFYPEQVTRFDWTVLKHPNTEFYIVRLPSLQEVQKYRRNRENFSGMVNPVILGPFIVNKPYFPTTTFTFIEGDSLGDYYEITLDEELFPNAKKRMILYSGSAIEIWRNENFLVGMRPFQEEK